ncbi:TPA: hypothetical protein ACGVAV_004428 [Vibrio vulnificus]
MKKILISNFIVLLVVYLGIRAENWATTHDRYLYLDGEDTISYQSTLTAVRSINEYINELCTFPESKEQLEDYRQCRDFYMKVNGWVSAEYATQRAKEASEALYGWESKVSSYVISFFGSYSYKYSNNSYQNKHEYIIDRTSRYKR